MRSAEAALKGRGCLLPVGQGYDSAQYFETRQLKQNRNLVSFGFAVTRLQRLQRTEPAPRKPHADAILDTSVQEKARRPGASLMACRYIEATVDQYGFDRERLLKRECAGPRSTTALHDRKQDDE